MPDQTPDLPVITRRGWDGPLALCSFGTHLSGLLPNGLMDTHRMGEGYLNRCPGAHKPPRTQES